VGEWDTLICRVPVSARPIMTMALANMQIVISPLLRSLRITKGPTRWLNGEPHRQRENLLDRPDGHKRACTSHALHACSYLTRSIFSNAPNFCRSAIAALVRACQFCHFCLPGGLWEGQS